MKDGRTHLAHKAEYAVDLDMGAIVGSIVHGADQGDTTTIQRTLPEVAEQLEAVAAVTDDTVVVIEAVVRRLSRCCLSSEYFVALPNASE